GVAADRGRRGGVGPVNGIAQIIDHVPGVGGLAGGEQVNQGGVGGEADRLVLVGHSALGGGSPAVAVGHGRHRGRVISRPGVVDGGLENRKGPGGDGGAGSVFLYAYVER